MKLLPRLRAGLLSALVLSASLTALPAQAETAPQPPGPSIYEGALVAFDPEGRLWVYSWDARVPHSGIVSREQIGHGWTVMRDIKIADWNQDGVQDIIAVGDNGNLYVYYGKRAGGFTRVTIGTGWGPYDISVDKWKKSDLYPSIIAANLDTGKLYNYPNLSGTTLSPRVVEGRGWGPSITHHLVDWDSDDALDVLGQETSSGNLVVYRTDGNGNFIDEPRLVVGRGWGSMNEVEAAPTFPGLLARTTNGDLYFYAALRARWLERQLIGTGWNGYTIAGF